MLALELLLVAVVGEGGVGLGLPGVLGGVGIDGDELGEEVLGEGVDGLGRPDGLGGVGIEGEELGEGELGGVGIETLLWLAQAPSASDRINTKLVFIRIFWPPAVTGMTTAELL